jgi:hypothetical protein
MKADVATVPAELRDDVLGVRGIDVGDPTVRVARATPR